MDFLLRAEKERSPRKKKKKKKKKNGMAAWLVAVGVHYGNGGEGR